MIVGIDLGTTNSLIGRLDREGVRLFVGENGSPLVPSLIYFPDQAEPVIGSLAVPYRETSPENTLHSIKRLMGRGLGEVAGSPHDLSRSDDRSLRILVNGKTYTPVELSSLILKKLRNLAEIQSGQSVRRAVITVPAYFNDSQRQATRLAGELAGLEVLRIVNEPTAACLAYGLNQKTKGTVAVYDLGGGTFDISVLRVQDGVFEVLATNGDTSLGGDDIDTVIARSILTDIQNDLGRHKDELQGIGSHLIVRAERLKRDLSLNESIKFSFELEGLRFERVYTRLDLSRWMAPLLERTRLSVMRCLKDSGLPAKELTDVILVGGSTRSPVVAEFVSNLFGRTPIATMNPDEVVVVGAAVQARILEGKLEGMLLLDVTPLSLGIETVGGIVEKIIHRNSTIPISASQTFTTSVDGQTSVEIHVLQGERELVRDNRSLAHFQLKGLPPMAAGLPKIEVEFTIDANGILSVRAAELRSGRAISISISPSRGLKESWVEAQLQSAYDHAEADFAERFLIQARNDADAILKATEKTVLQGASLLEGDERERIELAMKALRKGVASSDHKEIQRMVEDLNWVSREFAERFLNHSVSAVLQGKES